MNNRYKKLVSNSLVFAIGNLGSKLIGFLLVPLYTYVLTTSQYGTVDVLTTTVSVFLPISSLSIFDAVFRFIMDKNENKKSVFTNGLLVTIYSAALMIIAYPILLFFKVPLVLPFLIILFLNVLLSILQNFTRGIGFVKIFALTGIVNAIVLGLSNILFLVIFKLGIPGYLFSIIFSLLCSIIFISLSTRIWKFIDLRYTSFKEIKRFLKYSIPLIPNSLSWWLTNDASRFFILFFVGVSGNGLFAVSNKIPTILSVFFSIFAQAWQISAVSEFDKDDASEFYSKVFNLLISFSFILISLFILFVKPFMQIYVSSKFFQSWEYVPVLLLAATFSNFSAFLGTTYLAAKRTSGIFSTTVFGMIINVIACWLLIPIIGVHGAGIGGSLGFLTVTILRYFQTKRFLTITIDWKKSISSFVLILFMTGVLLMHAPFSYSLNSIAMILILIVNRQQLLVIAHKMIGFVLKRK
ncbi:lipopolysaccharide biosynthesis protein [Oenococcus sp. UCMA 17063]|nr:lipopolysaccharide biosynthesis protein [Oenococcus sp. UCMA 17063]